MEEGVLTASVRVILEDHPQCRVCDSKDVLRTGLRFRSSTESLAEGYLCKRCGTSFTAGTWFGKQFPRATIEQAVKMAKAGRRLIAICREVGSRAGSPVSYQTVLRWLDEFTPGLAYREAHKDEIAASKRAYYEAHKDEIAASERAYYEAHKDEIAASKRAYYEAHKDEIAASKRASLLAGMVIAR